MSRVMGSSASSLTTEDERFDVQALRDEARLSTPEFDALLAPQ